jgi:hypothetical protein
MKKLILPMVMFLSLTLAGNMKAQNAPVDPNAPVITLQRDTIDYGTIPHNADGFRAFVFTNTGKEPLMISKAVGSCGCTVPTAPTEPVQPGQTAEIKVHYATDRVGQFVKTITVTSNAANSPKILVIRGNILPDAATTNTTKVAPPVAK